MAEYATILDEVERRIQALSRILYNSQSNQDITNRERVIDALVDLIKALWPALLTLSHRSHASTRLYKLCCDISNLLRSRSEDEESLGSPGRSQEMLLNNTCLTSLDSPNIVGEQTTSLSGANVLAASEGHHGNAEPDLDFTLSDADIAAILEDIPPSLNYNAGMPAIPSESATQEDFESLLALVNNLEDSGLFPGNSFASMDEPLFVPETAVDGPTPPQLPLLVDPGNGNDDFVSGSSNHLSLSQPIREIALDSHSGPMIYPPCTNQLTLDIESASMPGQIDGGDISFPDTVDHESRVLSETSEGLKELAILLESDNLSETSLDWILPSHKFQCIWTVFNGTFVKKLLEQLTGPGGRVGKETVDYFVQKLASLHNMSETWIGMEDQLCELDKSRHRILVVLDESIEWSLIDVECHIGKVTHYRCCVTAPPYDHGDCNYCEAVVRRVNAILHQEGKSTPTWDCQWSDIATGQVGDGLWLIWLAKSRVEQKDPIPPVPAEYRSTLAREVVHDLNAARINSLVLSAGMPYTSPKVDDLITSAEAYWKEFGHQHGFGDGLWAKAQQLAKRSHAKSEGTIGLRRASELLQLAINIGSPEVLISLKGCLAQVRELTASSNPSYPETPWGTFDASRGHRRRENLAKIGMRLSHWRLQQWKKEYSDNIDMVVNVILNGKPPTATASRKEILERLKDKKASYWCHVVEHVGNHDPTILCLLPHTMTIGPPHWPRKLNATSYRDLTIWECRLLGEVYAELRPQVLRSADKDLAMDLLYLRDFAGFYRVETLSDEQIMSESLSSNFFVGILQKVSMPAENV